jgi:hypothetical protein
VNVYRNARAAKDGLLLYRTVRAALVDRTPDEAKAWLSRDAERSRSEARAFRERSKDAAEQVDMFTGRKAGPLCHQSLKLEELARTCDAEADRVERACEFVRMTPHHLEAAIDDAMAQIHAYAAEALKKKEEKAARIDPVKVAA